MLAAAVFVLQALGYADRGILKLDNTTFDRIVDGSRPVLVRFDKEYAYGDEVCALAAVPLFLSHG